MAESSLEEWNELEKEFTQLATQHRAYCQKVDEVKAIQRKCMDAIAHQRYRIKQITDTTKRIRKDVDTEMKAKLDELETQIVKRKNQFRELEDVLPHENGLYLKIVLGSVNVSLLSKNDKYHYKEDYERFKLYVTIVNLILATTICFFVNYRVTDAVFQFVLVWYYCTLTIREHILRVNGSRIKGWWILHHFISTTCAGIILIWPDGYTYNQFRQQFSVFSIYLGVVQLVQCYYQSGSLYRLRALGERRTMDITVEGFQSWMWKGLTFVLPFLIVGYLFQLYNAYVLYYLAMDPRCIEWQVLALSGIFLVLFLGNSWTTAMVMRHKIQEKLQKTVPLAYNQKYRFTNGNNTNGSNTSVSVNGSTLPTTDQVVRQN